MRHHDELLVSIVVPLFNEEDNITHFYEALCAVIDSRPERFEIVFVDDGSWDRTPNLLQDLALRDERVRSLILARNFGHQLALTCGMDYAVGDAVITMDGDMQHPPSLLPDLLQEWYDGYDVVQTVRLSTANVSRFKKWTSRGYYRFINAISKVEIVEGGSDFRLLDRKVVDRLSHFREHARFLRGIVSDIGYRQTRISFRAPERYAGESKFSLRKMVRFAIDGVTSYSTVPLRLALYLGLCMGLVSVFLIMYVLLVKYYFREAVSGWATVVVTTLLLGGIQLVFLGVIGEYIGRIFEEVKGRPLYWLRAVYGGSGKTDEKR